jgi:integrase
MTEAIIVQGSGVLEEAIEVYRSGLCAGSARVYLARIDKFMAWHAQQEPAPFVALLRHYMSYLQDQGLKPRTVQQHVNTIKGLIRTAAALDTSAQLAGFLSQLDLVKPPKVRGEVQGDRLDAKQRQALINQPGVDTHKGRRDTAILALMSVCGLRRSEVCALNWGHIAELDGHKVIKNLVGKHGRVRTVKMPAALWRRMIDYAQQAEISTVWDAPVFVAIRKSDAVQHGQRLTDNAIAWLVDFYIKEALIGCEGITAHDLRRTAANLSRKGGATIEQVQNMLGHSSPQTTSQYIGESLDLDDHAVDYSKVTIP